MAVRGSIDVGRDVEALRNGESLVVAVCSSHTVEMVASKDGRVMKKSYPFSPSSVAI